MTQEKQQHTYKAIRVTAIHGTIPDFQKTTLIPSLEDPLDKGRCDFGKALVVETHSFGGIKIEYLEQTQDMLFS